MATQPLVRPPDYTPTDPNAVKTDVQIVQSTVNVGEFGWTTNDMTSVKDIVRYVATAQKAAESADANAQYVQSKIDEVEQAQASIGTMVINITHINDNLTQLQKDVVQSVTNISSYLNQANDAKTRAEDAATRAKDSETVVTTAALSALYRFHEWGAVTSTPHTISPTDGTVQHIRLSLPLTEIVISPFDTGGTADPVNTARQLTLILEQGSGSNKIVFNTKSNAGGQYNKVRWNAERPPVLSYEVNKADVITLLTTDRGRSWLGFYNGGWFNMV